MIVRAAETGFITDLTYFSYRQSSYISKLTYAYILTN